MQLRRPVQRTKWSAPRVMDDVYTASHCIARQSPHGSSMCPIDSSVIRWPIHVRSCPSGMRFSAASTNLHLVERSVDEVATEKWYANNNDKDGGWLAAPVK